MIKVAYSYKDTIKEMLREVWYDEKYKYYFASRWHSDYETKEKEGDWNNLKFVSVNSKDNVLGIIEASIDRDHNIVSGLAAINLSENKVIFGRDIAQVIEDIFCKFNYRKMKFSVVCGNPIEDTYDRMVEKYGGRIVGIFKQDVMLLDNKMYDEKFYEIFRDDFIKSKGETKHE